MPLVERAAVVLATWFGCGYSRAAPGTLGSLGALPLYALMRSWPATWYWLTLLGLAVAGTWAAERAAQQSGKDDPQHVVIDEVSGVLIALGIARNGPPLLELLAFVLFRCFDIFKPGPIRLAERAKPRALGIMADDWAAGAAAGLFCYILQCSWRLLIES
jgi:phosphatidylglycerophosphatase A